MNYFICFYLKNFFLNELKISIQLNEFFLQIIQQFARIYNQTEIRH